MRLGFFLLAAVLAATPLAHAGLYDFSLKGVYVTDTPETPYGDEFTIDTSLVTPPIWPGFDRYCPDCFVAARPGGYYVVNRIGIVDIVAAGGDPLLPLEAFYFWDPTSPTASSRLFNGPSTHPVLTTGTYAFETSNAHGDADGKVTITDISNASPVPEPSTLALLGTGILGLAGRVRRRLA